MAFSATAASSRRLMVALRKTASQARLSQRPSVTPLTNSFLSGFEQRTWFSSYPDHEVVGLPKLSPTMDSGSISSWNLNEGDEFGAGDVLCSVETDKATMDFEAQDEGVLAKILVPAGPNEIPCGAPILITVEETSDAAAFKDYVVEDTGSGTVEEAAPEPVTPPPPSPAPTTPAAAPTPPPLAAPAVSSGSRVVASPLARMLSKEMGYDISSIPGTGPGGRIIAADVKEFVPAVAAAEGEVASATAPAAAAVPAAPIAGVGFTDYPLDASAQEAAARLEQSKRNVPHYYLSVDISMDQLLKTRSTLNALRNDDDSVGVYELLLKAAGSAMKAVPTANASWMDSVVRVYDSVDINVAIGSGDSLFTPVIRDCGSKGVKAISDDLSKATTYLEQQQVDDEEAAGEEVAIVDDETGDFSAVGTFTVINLGMYGVKACAPIIREPQACALALGALENRIVPNDDVDSEEIYKESVVMTATASFDHRVVDGAVGAQWLAAFKSYIENPTTLLL